MNPDRDRRRAELLRREHALHELYMDTAIGSAAERHYQAQLEQVMAELGAIYREEAAESGINDTFIPARHCRQRDIALQRFFQYIHGRSGSEL